MSYLSPTPSGMTASEHAREIDLKFSMADARSVHHDWYADLDIMPPKPYSAEEIAAQRAFEERVERELRERAAQRWEEREFR